VSQTLDAVLQKGQTMPEKNRFPAVLQPIVIDRAAFNQGENAKYTPHIGEADVMDPLVARGPHAVGVRDAGPAIVSPTVTTCKGSRGGSSSEAIDEITAIHLAQQQAAGIPFRKAKRAQSTTDDESWVEGQQSNTLNNFDVGDTRTTHAVVEQQVYENHAQDSRVTGPHAVAPTVAAKFGTGGGNVPLVNAEPHIVQASELRSMQDFNPSDPSFTLRRGGVQHGVLTPMAVRRLTPNECLRLQGFPDNWTNIPWKGKPTAPDGPQYKCAGNSFAVPVVRWIGTRIAAQP